MTFFLVISAFVSLVREVRKRGQRRGATYSPHDAVARTLLEKILD